MEFLVLTGLLIAAAFFDVRTRKIPNLLILGGLIFAIIVWASKGSLEGVVSCIVAVLVTLLCGFPLFYLRVIGAGDIKLLFVIAAVHGLAFLWQVVLIWLTVAGGVSVLVMLRKRLVRKRFAYLWHYLTMGIACGMPYYDESRDGKECTIVLAPILLLAYILVQIGRWNGFC